MKKVLSAIASVVLGCFFLAAFAGCSDTITSIRDIKDYSDIQNQTDKIDVEFDNHTGKPFNFTIEDENEIAEIMNILLTAELKNFGKGSPPPGDNTWITLHQGEKSYNLSVRINSEGGTYYAFPFDLQSKIIELAMAYGAYDTEVGVIYKVIDLQDIEEVEEEKITVSDKTAMLAKLKDDFDDCEYFYLFDSQELAEQYYSSGITERTDVAYQYNDTVTMEEGKLLLVYHIYQNYNADSYYITSPAIEEFGNLDNTAHIELAFGLWHNYYLKIQIACS